MGVCAISTTYIVEMAAHEDNTEINVNIPVTKTACRTIVYIWVENVRTGALIFIMGLNVSTSALLTVVPGVVTDIPVHVMDVEAANLVRLAKTTVA